ncbi:hypothetical protein AVEN_63062-1 [Araneus ventricosus]|uniref:PiggyBac transposable element-derived protein domain-containing protein n=1 Tax=Araneus ventricosus TaxID=182803 RepID=A0A4Y2H271_ARAVE|nr:hypothetical protein AVEN_63062-1 [Araneus ventricosus]
MAGTINNNRLSNAQNKLRPEKDLNRGEWDEVVRSDEKICIVKWKDNKSATLLSTCIGSEPVSTCRRWAKQEKKKIDVPQPAVINAYNASMEGIDLCDRYIAYYWCPMRTKKWRVRVFTHFVDLAISSCWIMYTRYYKLNKLKGAKSLMEFRMMIATALCKYVGSITPLRGRPRLSEISYDEEKPQRKQRRVVSHPIKDVRTDGFNHLPRFMDDKNASKCRIPGCKSRTRVICTKFNMYLCVLENSCFEKYHKNLGLYQ